MSRALAMPALLASVAALALLASTTDAKPAGKTGKSNSKTIDKKNHFELGHGSDWTYVRAAEPTDKASGKASTRKQPMVSLATLRHNSDDVKATLIRINHPNTPAWRKKKYYFDEVVRGLANATDGYKLESKKQSKLGRVPILDVRYRRTHATHPHVSVRFVFFRTLTLVLSAQATRAKRSTASALTRSIKPHL